MQNEAKLLLGLVRCCIVLKLIYDLRENAEYKRVPILKKYRQSRSLQMTY